MKPSTPLLLAVLAASLLSLPATTFAATEITVNSTNNNDVSDSEMTLTEAILYLNKLQGANDPILPRDLSPAESNQVATIAGTTNRIKFGIPGAGPHFIKAPIYADYVGLFPTISATNLIVDGYSQPGSSPNTNPILAANNAVLKIVLDARTSTLSEPFIPPPALTIVSADVSVRGLSILMAAVTNVGGIYTDGGIGFAGFGDGPCTGGSVQGCWLGVSPDQSIVAGGEIGIVAYNTGGGHVFGTDGDGVNDRNEFNVIVGCEVNIYLTGAANCRISGNFIGVMPNGISSIPPAAMAQLRESDGIYSDPADNLLIGTDSNGIADADERNIMGGLQGYSSNCEAIQLYEGNTNVVVMGNYFGVGVDGVTPLPNKKFFAAYLFYQHGTRARIGSNGDGVRDAIEANLIANHTGELFRFGNKSNILIFPGNSFVGNTGPFFRDPEKSFNGQYLGTADLALITPVISNSTTRAVLVGWVPVSAPGADNLTPAEISIYLADPTTFSTKPQGKTWLATYTDNGPQDLDPTPNQFQFNICALPIPPTDAKLVILETAKSDTDAGSSPFSAAFSLPDVSTALTISRPSPTSVSLSWQMNGVLQARPSLTSGTWTNVPGCSPIVLPASSGNLYLRVVQ